MNTKELLAVYGGINAVRSLWSPPLSRSAIYQWGDEVPKLRQYQIREMDPQIDSKIREARRRSLQKRGNLSNPASTV